MKHIPSWRTVLSAPLSRLNQYALAKLGLLNFMKIKMLEVTEVKSLQEFIDYQQGRKEEYVRRVILEKAAIGDPRGFAQNGYCAVCRKETTFHSDFSYAFTDAEGRKYPNWRERLVCSCCELNNRVRASIHLFEQECAPRQNADIYVTEQTTPLFAWIKSRYSSVVGSEFLGPGRMSGEINPAGIRHESLTGLSFADGSFDFILSFDVLEHIPDYKVAIKECSRVLRPGGQMLFSVPFSFNSNEHIVRARLREDGSVEHLMEPEYHGDPVNAAGCLCFCHFGWRLLDEFRDAGFDSVKALFYWSDKFGYLGFDQALFVATKYELPRGIVMNEAKRVDVSREVSPNDQMFDGNSVDQYLAGGKLALDLCMRALGNKIPARILDFPSGHGRVMRWLRHQWPSADIYALEVDTDALGFCEREFGAKTIVSRADIENLDLPNDVDLIWSGSLLTHFNERMWREFLTRCVDSLRPGGVLVFTTHGRLADMLANRGDPVFGSLVNLPRLCEDYRQTGFAYQDYDPAYPVYGLSFSSPSWVARQIEPLRYAKIIHFIEGGWGYQDVVAIQKLPTPI